MKAKYLWILAVCLAAGALFSSCKKDEGLNPGYGDVSDRIRMSMYAWQNTGFGNTQTPTEQDVIDGRVSGPMRPNKMKLIWFAVDEAVGYHIRIRLSSQGGTLGGPDTWTQESVYRDIIITDPTQTELVLDGMQYGMEYRFALRTLSPKGTPLTEQSLWTEAYEADPYHSQWYGYGDANQRDHCFFQSMYPRDGIPEIVTYDNASRTSTSVNVNLRLYWDDILVQQPEFASSSTPLNQFIADQFEGEGAERRFKVDRLVLEPTTKFDLDGNPIPTVEVALTEADKQAGEKEVTGLMPNVQYILNAVNDDAALGEGASVYDTYYNTEMVRMRGVGAPPVVEIEHVHYTPQELVRNPTESPEQFATRVRTENTVAEFTVKHDACRIDTILRNYMTNLAYAENTVFLLEGGKTYYMDQGFNISKGFILRSDDPENPARIITGGMWNSADGPMIEYDYSKATANLRQATLNFGRPPGVGEQGSIAIDQLIFENVIFEVLNFYTYEQRAIINGETNGPDHYFMNCNSQSMPFTCQNYEMRNVTFIGAGRGFIRFQGSTHKIIENFVIDNCLIYNCGHWDGSGRGYPFIAGDGVVRSNIFKNLRITNTTFSNISYDHLIAEAANRAWPATYSWNVTVENNTFLNWGAVSNDRNILCLRYPPKNSKFTVRKNLFVLCPAQGEDAANYYQAGMYLSAYPAGFAMDFADNYATSINARNGNAYQSNRPFTAITASYNIGGPTELAIKKGFPEIAPWDLLVDPYPAGPLRTAKAHVQNVPDGLYFKDTPAVRAHDIFTKGIGAPRWREHLQ